MSTVVSAVALAVSSTRARVRSSSTEIDSGVAKLGMVVPSVRRKGVEKWWSADPADVALADLRAPRRTAATAMRPVHGRRDDPDQPGVRGQALAGGRLVDQGFE